MFTSPAMVSLCSPKKIFMMLSIVKQKNNRCMSTGFPASSKPFSRLLFSTKVWCMPVLKLLREKMLAATLRCWSQSLPLSGAPNPCIAVNMPFPRKLSKTLKVQSLLVCGLEYFSNESFRKCRMLAGSETIRATASLSQTGPVNFDTPSPSVVSSRQWCSRRWLWSRSGTMPSSLWCFARVCGTSRKTRSMRSRMQMRQINFAARWQSPKRTYT
mmetsp:Transcript_35337/g.79772  ORF Transcript_35337/g.79772 Transcript_35337/m.79772 type:complete len:214 (+) Transcript_35337:1063-1704(+)